MLSGFEEAATLINPRFLVYFTYRHVDNLAGSPGSTHNELRAGVEHSYASD